MQPQRQHAFPLKAAPNQAAFVFFGEEGPGGWRGLKQILELIEGLIEIALLVVQGIRQPDRLA